MSPNIRHMNSVIHLYMASVKRMCTWIRMKPKDMQLSIKLKSLNLIFFLINVFLNLMPSIRRVQKHTQWAWLTTHNVTLVTNDENESLVFVG